MEQEPRGQQQDTRLTIPEINTFFRMEAWRVIQDSLEDRLLQAFNALKDQTKTREEDLINKGRIEELELFIGLQQTLLAEEMLSNMNEEADNV